MIFEYSHKFVTMLVAVLSPGVLTIPAARLAVAAGETPRPGEPAAIPRAVVEAPGRTGTSAPWRTDAAPGKPLTPGADGHRVGDWGRAGDSGERGRGLDPGLDGHGG